MYIDNDFHLDLKRLISLMSYQYQLHKEENKDSISLEEFLRTTLSRLIIYNCNDHYQFYCTLKEINTLLRNYSTQESPYKILVVDSLSAFYWAQKMEETHGISIKEISNIIMDIISFGRTICLFVAWKGGKDAIKFPNSLKIFLDFVRFRQNELVSQITLSNPDVPPFFLHVSSHGCSFSAEL